MKTYTIAQCARLLAQNNIDQPKAKYSNNVILAMLSTFDDNATVCVEPTRKGFELNRGSLVENLVKMALLDTDNGFKTAQRKSDIGRNAKNATAYGLNKNLKYEVKFATTFAPATESKPKTKYVILVTATGCYLIETANHQGRYTNNSDLDGTRLDELSARLGLWEQATRAAQAALFFYPKSFLVVLAAAARSNINFSIFSKIFCKKCLTKS